MGAVPTHRPRSTVSVDPCRVAPSSAGSRVFEGALPLEAITDVGCEVAMPLPLALLAVTATRSRCPTSAAEAVYCFEVAPAIVPQPPPWLSQRCHAYVNDVGDPVHAPLCALK